MDAHELVASYDRNGILGRLTGIGQADLDAVFRLERKRLAAELESARNETRRNRSRVTIDASALSGVNGADHWLVSPDGGATRTLDEFPEALAILDRSFGEELPYCQALDRARPLLARCAYNGLWSPSGTNWQPVRSIELSAEEVRDLKGGRPEACGLLVLARAKYQSILSDIACLCGFEQASGAESIDLGIWLAAAGYTARGHGWALEELPAGSSDGRPWSGRALEILQRRQNMLDGRSREAAGELIASIERGDHRPAALLLARGGPALELDEQAAGGLAPSAVDRLVEARSTQRVASPAGELDNDLLAELFESARDSFGVRDELECAVFDWHHEVPGLIGRAMHRGIEGEDGLMQRADLAGLCAMWRARGDLPGEIERWIQLPAGELEESGKRIALPARLVPAHVQAKLTEAGHFRPDGELLLDHRERPLTPVRLIKLVRMMSRSFGKFFLSFQNTHPLTGVILARCDRQKMAYQAAGRVVCRMSLVARARGLVSIIKSGPIEIAGPAIRDLLAEKAEDVEIRERIANGDLRPILTFQLGEPLGPDDIVGPGRPDEHDGLAERLLDKRAPRASLAEHYLPRP